MLGWRLGKRRGMVVKGVGGPGRGDGGGNIRTGGHGPEGAEVEYAYRAGYDSRGRASVTHIVERGYCALLVKPETKAACGRTARGGWGRADTLSQPFDGAYRLSKQPIGYGHEKGVRDLQ